jgi:hypothetical protein
LRHSLRRGRDSNAGPFLGLHPGFAVPPSVSANRNSSADMRTRFGQPLAAWLWMAGVHSSFPSERKRSIVVTELIELRFYASPRPPTKHTDEFLLLPTFQQTLPDKTKFSAVQPSAGLPSSPRSLQLRSALPVNPACAALRGAYPKPAPCSLPRPFRTKSGDVG